MNVMYIQKISLNHFISAITEEESSDHTSEFVPVEEDVET